MILREANDVINIPIDRVWQWVKDFENIVSVIPRVVLLEMKGSRVGLVKGVLFPEVLPITLPEEIAVAEADMVEVNEPEKYTRTITQNDVIKIESFLECENLSENKTELHMAAKISLKGKSGDMLERLVSFTPFVKLVTGTKIEEILDNLCVNLKDHTRNFWRKELEKKTKKLQSFVYTVSHDLQTPLMSIRGFSDTIREEFEDELDENGLHYLERVQANVKKMNNFIDDLLELSKVTRKEVETEEVDSEEVAREIVSDLSSKLEEKNISVEIDDKLPVVNFERNRLYQIFSNLVSNACKYIGDQENPEIQIGKEERIASWVLWVRDNGIGIKEENQDNVFELFDREKRVNEDGTGVGLALVKRVIEKYDGDIWVESEEGEGSQFFVKIPKVEDE